MAEFARSCVNPSLLEGRTINMLDVLKLLRRLRGNTAEEELNRLVAIEFLSVMVQLSGPPDKYADGRVNYV